MRPLFFANEIYRHSTYGPRHPLAIKRVPLVVDLCRALDWLPEAQYRDAPMADEAALARFHDPAYIAALQQAEREQKVAPELAQRFNLGRLETPVFPEMYRRPATSAGAALAAAATVLDGGLAYTPAGGTHHGMRARASGFCFFNDPVLAILYLLDRGVQPVAYVDLDVHHGDGVEAAFAGDARVLTLSIHEAGRWPHTGLAEDRAGGSARNFPVPPPMNDSELDWLMDAAVVPLLERFRPAALVVQGGSDALADDPLAKQEWSNGAMWRAVARLMPLAPRLIVTGGGGYNPWAVAHCWSGVWATLNHLPIPETLPPAAQAVLEAIVWQRAAGRNPPPHWFTTLRDPPRPGPVRDMVKRLADLALAER